MLSTLEVSPEKSPDKAPFHGKGSPSRDKASGEDVASHRKHSTHVVIYDKTCFFGDVFCCKCAIQDP